MPLGHALADGLLALLRETLTVADAHALTDADFVGRVDGDEHADTESVYDFVPSLDAVTQADGLRENTTVRLDVYDVEAVKLDDCEAPDERVPETLVVADNELAKDVDGECVEESDDTAVGLAAAELELESVVENVTLAVPEGEAPELADVEGVKADDELPDAQNEDDPEAAEDGDAVPELAADALAADDAEPELVVAAVALPESVDDEQPLIDDDADSERVPDVDGVSVCVSVDSGLPDVVGVSVCVNVARGLPDVVGESVCVCVCRGLRVAVVHSVSVLLGDSEDLAERDADAQTLVEGVAPPENDGDCDAEPLFERHPLVVPDSELLAVKEAETVEEAHSEGAALGEMAPVRVIEFVALPQKVVDDDALPESDARAETVADTVAHDDSSPLLLFVGVCDVDPVKLRETVAVADTLRVAVVVNEDVGHADAEAQDVATAEADGEPVKLGVSDADADALRNAVDVKDPLGDRDGLGLAHGLVEWLLETVPLGESDGDAETLRVTVSVGETLGDRDALGLGLGQGEAVVDSVVTSERVCDFRDDIVTDTVPLREPLDETLGDAEKDAVTLGETDTLKDCVPVRVTSGERDGDTVVEADGDTDADGVDERDAVVVRDAVKLVDADAVVE